MINQEFNRSTKFTTKSHTYPCTIQKKKRIKERIKASFFFLTIFRQGQAHSFLSSIASMLLETSNETSRVFPANQQATTYPNPQWFRWSHSSSEDSSSPCHKSEANHTSSGE